jgi:PGAP1-like protein
MSGIDQTPRFAPGGPGANGDLEFSWQLTSAHLTDPVILELPPDDVLPVIFVPGIMGSNLKTTGRNESVWRLDNSSDLLNVGPLKNVPVGLAGDMINRGAGDRQTALNPATVEVDPSGAVPKQLVGSVYSLDRYRSRGWGEVGEGSYHEFLLWLERVLNGQGYSPAKWPQFSHVAMSASPEPGERRREAPRLAKGIRMSMRGLPTQDDKGPVELLSDDLIARARFRMPVYAFGYNWLESNNIAATLLAERVKSIIAENNHAHSRCSQVVLVTHSMGGLVARACQQLPGMHDVIAGMVHGVMPSVGAAVVYRRCKIGMKDEDPRAGVVIGNTGQEVTAVFAQAPGALQLLPTAQYRGGWLTIDGPSGRSLGAEPSTGDPYRDIYLREDRWWGLIRKEWLNPPGGTGFRWGQYSQNLELAETFHAGISNSYHRNTYVFYGKDKAIPSFEGVHWKIKAGALRPEDQSRRPTPEQVRDMGFGRVRDDGSNPLRVGGKAETVFTLGSTYEAGSTSFETSHWDLICAKQDGGGDGTVPVGSGAFPLRSGGEAIQQQFGLPDVKHEAAYRDETAQLVVLYALQKIASKAKVNP